MKWIAASERLPNVKGLYNCKYDGQPTALEFDGVAFLFSYKNGLPDSKIEWLDESLAGVREALEELLTKIPIDKAFNNVYLPGFYEAVEKGKAALGDK